MPKFNHICTDIETLSTRSDAVIVSIAAVKFNLHNSDIETFTVNISPSSSVKLGLHVDPVTVKWWRDNKPEAVRMWMDKPRDAFDAITRYTNFVGTDKETKHWCNGTNFDYPILESTYRALNLKEPWKYWNLCDMRTAFYLGGLNTFNEIREGTYHSGLDDCLTQILWLKKAIGVKSE